MINGIKQVMLLGYDTKVFRQYAKPELETDLCIMWNLTEEEHILTVNKQKSQKFFD